MRVGAHNIVRLLYYVINNTRHPEAIYAISRRAQRGVMSDILPKGCPCIICHTYHGEMYFIAKKPLKLMESP